MNIFTSQYKTYIKNLSVYFSASLIPMIISVVTNPIFAYFLSPKDYAIIGYYTSFNTLFSPFILFYMLHYYQRMYFKVTLEERKRLKIMLTQALFFFSFILFLISLFAVYIYTRISPNEEMPFFPYAILALLPCWFVNFYTLECIELKMERKSVSYLRLNIINIVVTILVSLFLVVCLNLGALGKMLGTLLGPIVIFLYLLFKRRIFLDFSFKSNVAFREMVVFCLPLVGAAMLGFFSNGYDRVYLERLVSTETLGYYSVGVTIAGYLNVFSKAIGDTFSPDIFQSVAKRQFKRSLKFIFIQIMFVSFIVLVFIILSPFLVYLLTAGKYMNSVPYVKIISLASISSCMYYAVSQMVVAMGFTKITLLNKIVGSICCVAMYSVFISHWRAEGAAWSIVCSHLIFLVGMLLIVGGYKFKRMLQYVKR